MNGDITYYGDDRNQTEMDRTCNMQGDNKKMWTIFQTEYLQERAI